MLFLPVVDNAHFHNVSLQACAPRYVFHTMTPKKNLRWDPIGTCFTTRNFTKFKEVSPCRTSKYLALHTVLQWIHIHSHHIYLICKWDYVWHLSIQVNLPIGREATAGHP